MIEKYIKKLLRNHSYISKRVVRTAPTSIHSKINKGGFLQLKVVCLTLHDDYAC